MPMVWAATRLKTGAAAIATLTATGFFCALERWALRIRKLMRTAALIEISAREMYFIGWAMRPPSRIVSSCSNALAAQA